MNEFVDSNAKLLSLLCGKKSLSMSAVKSRAAKALFLRLEQSGLVQKQRKGAGNHYQLLDELNLDVFIKNEYPSGLYRHDSGDAPRRVQGISTLKNSKSLKKLDFDVVTLRGHISLYHDAKLYNLADFTNKNTYLSVKLNTENFPDIQTKNSTVVTVENPTAFVELESMFQVSWDMVVYTGGKMSNILLQQLEYWGGKGHKMIHFGDYDYVGLLEFSRILRVCPDAELYAPSLLTVEFFQQYGNTTLLEDQSSHHRALQTIISELLASTGKSQLINIYNLIQKSARGLEQESLYLCGQR